MKKHQYKNRGNMKKENGKLFLAIKVVAALFCACQPEIPEIVEPEVFTDVDDNIYDTVRIGAQTWMSQDLRVKHFPDGSALREFEIKL